MSRAAAHELSCLEFGWNVGQRGRQVKANTEKPLPGPSPSCQSFAGRARGMSLCCSGRVCTLLLVVLPSLAEANVIWPAALLTGRLLTWWVIAASVAIETVFVWRAFRLPVLKAFLATLAANAASAAIGLFAVPFLGLLFEVSLQGSGIAVKIDWNAFSLAGWIATFIIAVAFNEAIELAVYRYGFRLALDRRVVLLICLANVITVGLAFASLDVVPSADYGTLGPGLFAK